MPRTKKTVATPPPNKQVLTMPEAGTTTPVRKTSSSTTPVSLDLNSQIRQRAYELYQERGGAPGHENEDWLRAENEVLSRQNVKQSA